MKHTKGKWSIYETACQEDNELLIGSDDQEIYPLATVNHTIEEGEANAKLISKAPEMYEALKNLPIHQLSLLDSTKDKIKQLLKEIDNENPI